jgi:hypothetical protein
VASLGLDTPEIGQSPRRGPPSGLAPTAVARASSPGIPRGPGPSPARSAARSRPIRSGSSTRRRGSLPGAWWDRRPGDRLRSRPPARAGCPERAAVRRRRGSTRPSLAGGGVMGAGGSGLTAVPPRWFWEIDRMLRSVRGVGRAGGPRRAHRARALGPSGHPRIRVAEFLPFALILEAGIPARRFQPRLLPPGTDSETPGVPARGRGFKSHLRFEALTFRRTISGNARTVAWQRASNDRGMRRREGATHRAVNFHIRGAARRSAADEVVSCREGDT